MSTPSTKSSGQRRQQQSSAQSGQSAQGKQTAQGKQSKEEQEETAAQPRTATVTLPFVTAEFRMPQFRLPTVSRREVTDAAGAVASAAPPPEQLAYYGGLGLLAVLELIDWPVAVAVGAGTVIAQRARRQGQHSQPEAGQTATAS